MRKKLPPIEFNFGDLVSITSGFYKGQKAILTWCCPETGRLCGFIDGDGTEDLHHFFDGQLTLVDKGYYFSCEVGEDDEFEAEEEES